MVDAIELKTAGTKRSKLWIGVGRSLGPDRSEMEIFAPPIQFGMSTVLC